MTKAVFDEQADAIAKAVDKNQKKITPDITGK